MLKIKDNVGLKELEEFDFNYVSKDEKHHDCYFKKVYLKNDKDDRICYEIELPSMEIKITRLDGQLDDTLYDLIKADLVEKIKE